ncbi:MAG TPA: energy transducer TonB [Terriglobales bacterium]|nr:energy transducer TonB [Terriglobales bacterium]
MDQTLNSLLAPLAVPPARTRQFSVSLIVHGLVLTGLALIPITHPEAVSLRSHSTYLVMPLMSEYQAPRHVPAAPKVKLPPVPQVAPETVARLQPPLLPRRVVREVEAPKIVPAKFDPVVAPPVAAQPKLARQVKTGLLGQGSSAPATVKAPAQKVQTGGFGDENGVNGEGRRDARLVVAHLGSSDLPAFGGGYGNGSGGTHGVRGTVSSAGFGNGVATSVAGGSARQVQAGGFGDGSAVASGSVRRVQSDAGELKPVEILSKPRPVYSAEARQMKIEGEVLLDVTFGADGTLHVQRVDRGLGHGLDEAAIRAAQQIRFRPARRDGQPLDTVAVLHIVFELAY